MSRVCMLLGNPNDFVRSVSEIVILVMTFYWTPKLASSAGCLRVGHLLARSPSSCSLQGWLFSRFQSPEIIIGAGG